MAALQSIEQGGGSPKGKGGDGGADPLSLSGRTFGIAGARGSDEGRRPRVHRNGTHHLVDLAGSENMKKTENVDKKSQGKLASLIKPLRARTSDSGIGEVLAGGGDIES